MKLIKSPLNYVGGKFKLLPQLLELFPKEIDTFYDLFAGGFNVGINIKADKIICNDTQREVVDLIENLYVLESGQALEILKNTINKYQLSKTNREGFLKIREDYNNGNRSWDMFYALITNAFNNQIRFNQQGGYNIPFGKDRTFNPALERRFIDFVDTLKLKNIEFICKNFSDIEIEEDGFVYCDPPYLLSTASYNENGGWNEEKEIELLEFLDKLNNMGVKFALSNVLESKGQTNEILKDWSKKYNINYLNISYGNSNHQRTNKDKKDIEVLITNY